MKKKVILLGSAAAIALTVGTMVSSPEETGSYSPRTAVDLESTLNSGANGMLEWMDMARAGFTNEDYKRALEEAKAMPQNRASLGWRDHGPDNVGGRTRAILVDRSDINHIYAGSVSGGLFESTSRANFWSKVESFNDNLAVSGICQMADGTIFVSTGHRQETSGGFEGSGANGDGVYKQMPDGNWEQVSGTTSWSYVNEVRADTVNNWIWIASSGGLKKYIPATDDLQDSPDGFPSGGCTALSVSPDGMVLIAAGNGTKTFVSVDAGVTFTEYSDDDNTANPIPNPSGRVEYAMSHEKQDGAYVLYASFSDGGGRLEGVWRSPDNGVNWTEIAPANDGTPGSFAPFQTGGANGQGLYNNIITVQPGNPDRVLLGGIDCYAWATDGNWEQVSQWFLSPTSPIYVHADNHEMTWDRTGRLYIGNDGGIAVSEDGGNTFYPANRGYNVTQFYDIGFSANGDVSGGTQDNGNQINYHTNSTYQEHKQSTGGDGFASDISFINRNISFSSIYYAAIFRSSDRGGSSSDFSPPLFDAFGCTPGDVSGSGCGSFNTRFTMWEDPNDEDSKDTILFIPSESYNIGDEVLVPSATTDVNISFTSPINIVFDDTLFSSPGLTTQDTIITTSAPVISLNLNEITYEITVGGPSISVGDSVRYDNEGVWDTVYVASVELQNHYYGTNPLKPGIEYDMGADSIRLAVSWDTLKVQDRFQSWMALGLGGGQGVWMTRNALRFSSVEDGWIMVADGISTVTALQYSKDGEHLFIGCSDGSVHRLSGFGDVYSPVRGEDTLIDYTTVHSATTFTQIHSSGKPVLGIATGSDPDHVVIATGGGSGDVRESFNATGGSPSFTTFTDLPSQPFYACVIDRDDPNILMAGGDVGLFLSTNGGSDWEYCGDAPFGNTPVFDMGQNYRTWDEGCYRPGEIYVGTHGRGIWSTDEYLSLPGMQDNLATEKFISNIQVYPNPVVDQGNVAFELESYSDATIQIFNLNGQVVSEITKGDLAPGSNSIAFETSTLPRGTYIVRLVAGEMIETTKFIKQ